MSEENGIAGTGIKLGITLYSLTSEFAAGLYTPETLIKVAADEGLGPGVEVRAVRGQGRGRFNQPDVVAVSLRRLQRLARR